MALPFLSRAFAAAALLPLAALAAQPPTGATPMVERLAPDVHAAIRAGADGPAVVAHRGASALRPEHTISAYGKAIEDGADFIEPDLVMTQDGVLVARHENEIGGTTDVAAHPGFASRKVRRSLDGHAVEGWFTEDFTLAELRTLRARERLPAMRGTAFDGQSAIPTLVEILDFAAKAAKDDGRKVGVVVEIKHSTHHHARGLDPEAALLEVLRTYPHARKVPFGVQSFEVGNLRRLRGMLDAAGLRNVFLVQLVAAPSDSPFDRASAGEALRYGDMLTPAGLAEIARYADVLAPPVRMVLPVDADGAIAAPTPLVAAAHGAGLAVHPWTLRPENQFLPKALRCGDDANARCDAGARREAQLLANAGVDAMFADDPGLTRDALRNRKRDAP